MASYIGMYTRSKKRIKMKMETIVGHYSKGNEINSWCLLCVGLHLVLTNNNYSMRCHHQTMLHQICMS